jgi:hypothetical protein
MSFVFVLFFLCLAALRLKRFSVRTNDERGIELCLLVVGVVKNTSSACLSGAACTGEGEGGVVWRSARLSGMP